MSQTEYMREYRKRNPNSNRDAMRRYNERHPGAQREALQRRRADNPERDKEHHDRGHQLYHERYPFMKSAYNRINEAMHGRIKAGRTMELVGCTAAELRDHLESQFQPGMSWENYGEWHVDHRRPCASFDLLDPAQQLECFHHTNLQPLWALDNLRKSKK